MIAVKSYKGREPVCADKSGQKDSRKVLLECTLNTFSVSPFSHYFAIIPSHSVRNIVKQWHRDHVIGSYFGCDLELNKENKHNIDLTAISLCTKPMECRYCTARATCNEYCIRWVSFREERCDCRYCRSWNIDFVQLFTTYIYDRIYEYLGKCNNKGFRSVW